MRQTTIDHRLRLFAFTQADNRHRYLAILSRFNEERERSRLQLSPLELVGEVELPDSEDAALAALDQLHAWGLLDRLQDDRRVRTVAEYRQRRSVYQMTELGWLAWSAVGQVLEAAPGEAELRRLVLARVGDDLEALGAAVDVGDSERVGALLQQLHLVLSDLAQHAARFTLATSELASAWEADPAAFLTHKNRLLGHLNGFLTALTAHHPRLAASVADLVAREERLLALAIGSSAALTGTEQARERVARHWQGVVAWFLDRPGHPSQAALLEDRTNRAIRDLAVLLKRVLDATAGGVSRGTQLELLAGWFAACPSDEDAHGLAGLLSGLRSARHFGTPEADADATAPSESWWSAEPAPVDTTLRRHGRASSPGAPRAVPDRSREARVLRMRQAARRRREEAAGGALVQAMTGGRPLDRDELRVLLRLLSRALHTRRPAQTTAWTRRGALRLRLEPAETDMLVSTTRGVLLLPKHSLQLSIVAEIAQ